MLFTPAERRLLAFLVLLLSAGYLLTALRHWGLLPPAAEIATPESSFHGDRILSRPMPIEPADPPAGLFVEGRLALNRADSLALLGLPGIGPALSGRILARRRCRSFNSVDELLEVRGIGPKTLDRLRGFLIVLPSSAHVADREDEG